MSRSLLLSSCPDQPETMAPGVVIDGQTYQPPGWMWVLAFALRGVPWAVTMATSPDFQQQKQAWEAERLAAGKSFLVLEPSA